jgi:hypothetical protein
MLIDCRLFRHLATSGGRQDGVQQLSFIRCRLHKCSAAMTAGVDSRSPNFFRALKSAEHFGGNDGGNSLSFRSIFTLKFDSRRLQSWTSVDYVGRLETQQSQDSPRASSSSKQGSNKRPPQSTCVDAIDPTGDADSVLPVSQRPATS